MFQAITKSFHELMLIAPAVPTPVSYYTDWLRSDRDRVSFNSLKHDCVVTSFSGNDFPSWLYLPAFVNTSLLSSVKNLFQEGVDVVLLRRKSLSYPGHSTFNKHTPLSTNPVHKLFTPQCFPYCAVKRHLPTTTARILLLVIFHQPHVAHIFSIIFLPPCLGLCKKKKKKKKKAP